MSKLLVLWNNPKKDIFRKLSVKDNLFITGENNKKIIDSAMRGYDGHRGYIYYLAVLHEFEKKDVGSNILRLVEGDLLKLGCIKINLFVRNYNLNIQTFYKKRLIDDN